jgi:flavodoxin
MSQPIIYYFSATGNCFEVARTIASEIEAKLEPITPITPNTPTQTDSPTIGFIYPTYNRIHAKYLLV